MAKIIPNEVELINIISAGTVIVGDIKTDGVIRLNGSLTGNLDTLEKLVIGQNGKIVGDVTCKSADIEGEILGTLKVNELLILRKTANIKGDMVTRQLSVEPGALFTGTCKMPQPDEAEINE